MHSVEARGTRFAYSEDGSGQPVVLVHGSASDCRTWEGQREPLARRFRVVAYSRRWHWPNAPVAQGVDYAMDEHVEDLRELLPALGGAPAHLVGHSYGAFLCLLVALRAPHLVRSLVLAEPPALTLFVSPEPRPLELLRLAFTRPRTAAAIVRFGAKGVAPARRAFQRGDAEAGVTAFAQGVFGGRGYERLRRSQKIQVRDNLANVQAELLGSGFLPLPAEAVRALRAPVLLVSGERSIGLFRRLTEALAELLPHAERAVIPGAGHAMHEDNPTAYNVAVVPFIAKHAAKS